MEFLIHSLFSNAVEKGVFVFLHGNNFPTEWFRESTEGRLLRSQVLVARLVGDTDAGGRAERWVQRLSLTPGLWTQLGTSGQSLFVLVPTQDRFLMSRS